MSDEIAANAARRLEVRVDVPEQVLRGLVADRVHAFALVHVEERQAGRARAALIAMNEDLVAAADQRAAG
jgi:hypothetical protein